MMKKPRNRAECRVYEQMTKEGWFITRKGWPDFACFKDNKLVLIEVKPKRSHRLKRMQYKVMLALAAAGVECYRWSPDGGFERITVATNHV